MSTSSLRWLQWKGRLFLSFKYDRLLKFTSPSSNFWEPSVCQSLGCMVTVGAWTNISSDWSLVLWLLRFLCGFLWQAAQSPVVLLDAGIFLFSPCPMLCGEVPTFGFPNSKRVLAFLRLFNLNGCLERQSNFRNFNEFASVLFRQIIWFHISMHKSSVTFFLALEEKASFDGGTQSDTVDSIWHIVWLLINLNAAPTKLAVAWKWSSRKAQNYAGNVEAKSFKSPEPPFDCGDGHRLHAHTHTLLPPSSCLSPFIICFLPDLM